MCDFKMSSRSTPSQNQTAKLNLQELSAEEDRVITGIKSLKEKNLELTNSYRDAKSQIQELIAENTGLQEKNLELTNSYRHAKRRIQELILQNNISQQELLAGLQNLHIVFYQEIMKN